MSAFKGSSIYGVLAWGVYDWANSAFPTVITTFIFATYFTQAIAKNPIVGTNQWGHATALAGFLIAIFGPILGAAADSIGRKKCWVGCFTLVCVIACALLWFAKPSPSYITWALTWVVIATVGYELALVFYNAMMGDLVEKKYLGRLSGFAWGFGYAGGITCLVVALFFMYFKIPWLNNDAAEHIRITGPLVAVWFTVFSLPFFLFTPERKIHDQGVRFALKQGCRKIIDTFKHLKNYKMLLIFLLAHMIYIDGLNTIFAFGGIYAAGTFAFSPEEIIIFGILINVTAGLGAVMFAWIDDFLGAKETVLIALAGLIFSSIGILLVSSTLWFWILALLLGVFVGPVQASSRSLMAELAPQEASAQFFGLYAFSGKITGFAGPWILAVTTLAFASQRIGMSTVVIFLIMGFFLLLTVRTPKRKLN